MAMTRKTPRIATGTIQSGATIVQNDRWTTLAALRMYMVRTAATASESGVTSLGAAFFAF